jgi:hypothetical protein
MTPTCGYENVRRIVYGDERATFVPVCSKCGRFVKPDVEVVIRCEALAPGANATCSRCGRVEMLFEGFV